MDKINLLPKFTISGSVKNLLKGLESVDSITPDILIGLPINDAEGNKIGTITHIEDDFWYADVEDQDDILKQLQTGGK